MKFCGEEQTFLATKDMTECLADILGMLPPGGLLLFLVPYTFIKWFMLRSPCDMTNTRAWVRFPAHNLRWIVTLILLFFYVLDGSEGVISDWSSRGINLNFYVPQVLHLIAAAFSLVYYNFLETYNYPHMLIFLLFYWMAAMATRMLKILSLYDLGLDYSHARVDIQWLILVSYTILLSIDIYVAFIQRYLCSNPVILMPAEELSTVSYVHPYTDFFSRMLWGWMNPLLALGYKKPLEMEDLGAVPHTEHSKINFEKFKKVFEEEKARMSGKVGAACLWRSYWRTYWPMLLLAAFYKLGADCLIFVSPMCLEGIITYVIESSQKNETNTTLPQGIKHVSVQNYLKNGYVLAILSLGAMLLQSAFWQNNFYLCIRQGIRLKAAIQAMVYDKALKLSSWSLGEGGMTQGQVMNHMAVDPMHLCMFFYYGHFTWSLPLQVIITFILLYIQLGTSALFSAVLLLVLVPFQYQIGKKLACLQKKALEHADVRLKRSNELLQSIKLLKLYAWEVIFCRAIEETRKKELAFLLKAAWCRVISICITDGAPLAAMMITFSVYPYIEQEPLKASKVFSSLALFNILGLPLYLVTLLINVVTHAKVSTERLLPFFLAPEVEVDVCSGEEDIQKDLHLPDVEVHPSDGPPKIPNITVDDTDRNSQATAPLLSPPEGTTVMNGTVAKSSVHEPQVSNKCSEGFIHPVTYGPAVSIEKGCFSWDLNGKKPVLKEINVKIPQGELTVVVGQVGSGKSSLLSAMLREMITVSGKLTWKKGLRVAYGGQKAWLMNATVRENILFNHTFDPNKYNKVLDVCALKPDLRVLPAGDRTEIGEKGINLSGGQKQRISIARALYCNADVVMLDDPLSALDVHVGSHIFQHAILDFLLGENKTVLLVTHHLQYMHHAHQVLVLNEGCISHQGSLDSIKQMDPDLYQEWTNTMEQTRKEEKGNDCFKPPDLMVTPFEITPECIASPGAESYVGHTTLSSHSLSHLGVWDEAGQTTTARRSVISLGVSSFHPEVEVTRDAEVKSVCGKLIRKEERSTGSVKLHVYLAYAQSGTLLLTFLMIIGYLARQGIRMGTDFWLATWSEQAMASSDLDAKNRLQGVDNTTASSNLTVILSSFHLEYWVGGYMILCSVGIVFGLLAVTFLELMCINAARNLHQNMLTTLTQAPTRFFDTTPMGRIINRLSGDTNIIDEKMPVTVDGVLFCFVYVLGGLVVNAVSTPAFLIPSIPMFVVYIVVQHYYIASSRELQRLDSITKSPILTHFNETLGGLSTIRAYKVQHHFQERNWQSIDENNTAYLYLQTANVWMGIRLDIVGACIVFTASACSITSGIYGYATPGVVGLAIAYAIMISGFINWLMRMISEVEMYFTSVERVSHFASIQQEPQPSTHDLEPPSHWPSQGEINFDSVSLRYDTNLEPVIRNMNLHIRGGEKIGICGRTGSGKSSMTLGLFRIIDICSGHLLIDGIDISQISLHKLRSKLSIIPQDPMLFEGSIRFNLDPDKTKTDEETWKALEIAQLHDVIASLPNGIDSCVSEGGENFSVGQRQLFCLARAFLRDSQILILDEATASIDMATDTAIQQVILQAFRDKTVITIAHRVGTILQCDKILVLSNGEIIEHDTPQNLLSTDSHFAAMVNENK